VPLVWKFGSLNLLEPSGHDQARNGITLHLVAPNVPDFMTGRAEKYFEGRSQEFQSIYNEKILVGLISNNKK
jgi:hypothetical protein